jgi:hypothetical protein
MMAPVLIWLQQARKAVASKNILSPTLMKSQEGHSFSFCCGYRSEEESVYKQALFSRFGMLPITWRKRAAEGNIPGAIKKGKQWLLPVSVLRSLLGVNLPPDYGRMEEAIPPDTEEGREGRADQL